MRHDAQREGELGARRGAIDAWEKGLLANMMLTQDAGWYTDNGKYRQVVALVFKEWESGREKVRLPGGMESAGREGGDVVAEQCGWCAKKGVPLFKCLRCKVDTYCGKDCQRAAWPTHKKGCSRPLLPGDVEQQTHAGGEEEKGEEGADSAALSSSFRGDAPAAGTSAREGGAEGVREVAGNDVAALHSKFFQDATFGGRRGTFGGVEAFDLGIEHQVRWEDVPSKSVRECSVAFCHQSCSDAWYVGIQPFFLAA
jgi:hypothetical protein